MKSHPSPRSSGSPRVGAVTVARVLIALCALGYAYLLLGNAGCSSPTCYRNTDCPYGSDCIQGQCVRRTSSEAGVAGGSSSDTGAAGDSN